MRATFVRSWAVPDRWLAPLTLALTASCAPAPRTSTSVPPSDAMLVTVSGVGRIHTFDPAMPEATAMVVVDGRIVASGERPELQASYPSAVVHDLGDRTILPGIIDAHTHVREFGADALLVDVESCPDVACMVKRLRLRHPDPEPGAWLVADGWDEGAWASRGYPDRAELDAAFPENPVLASSLHGFASLVNARALARAGIDASTPDPEGGTIVRDDSGRPTGVLLTLAQALVRRQLPPMSDDDRRAAILAGLEQLASAGVTCIHEAGMSAADTAAFVALAESSALPIRVYGLLDGNDTELMDTWLERGPRIDPTDWLTIRGIKVFYDGSLGSRTALLAEPYADEPASARPTERIAPEAMARLAERAAISGFQIAVHTIGDEANTRVLDLFARTFEAHPGDHRWRLEHAQVVQPGTFERAAALGVVANMQPSHAVGDSPWAEQRLGPERITRAYAWRDVLEAGAPLVLSSDLPGEPWMPMQTLYFAVTRQPLDGSAAPWHPEQALTRDEALAAMTIAAARVGFAEDRLGVLRPGAWADFIVLGQDPWSVSDAALASVMVEQTWVAGRRVATPPTK